MLGKHFQNIMLSCLCTVGNSLLLLGLNILLARNLTLGSYSLLATAIAIATIFDTVFTFGLNKLTSIVIPQYLGSNPSKVKSFIFDGYIIILGVFILVSFPLIYLMFTYAEQPLLRVICIGLLISPLTAMVKFSSSILIAKQVVWKGMLLNEILALLGTLLAVLAWMFIGLPLDVYSYFIALALASLMTLFLCVKEIQKAYPVKLWEKKYKKNMTHWFRSGFPMMYSTFTLLLANNIGTIVLKFFGGANGFIAGLFVAIYMISHMVVGLQVSLDKMFIPKISERYGKKDWSGFNKVLKQRMFASILMYIFFFFIIVSFGKYFLSLFGDEFVATYVELLLLSVVFMTGSFLNINASLLILLKEGKRIIYIQNISAIFAVSLAVILVLFIGIYGVLIAVFVSKTVVPLYNSLYLHRRYGISIFGFPAKTQSRGVFKLKGI